MCSLHQDLSGGNIRFDHMTLIVTFDLLSKHLNMAPKFITVRDWVIRHNWPQQHCTINMSITDDSNESKINPSCPMLPALIKATYNDYFSILHFIDSLTSLLKATCTPPLPLVTLLSYT